MSGPSYPLNIHDQTKVVFEPGQAKLGVVWFDSNI
jgi:hypothetical protein